MEDENDLPMEDYWGQPSLASSRDSSFRYLSDAILLRVSFCRNIIMELIGYRFNFF